MMARSICRGLLFGWALVASGAPAGAASATDMAQRRARWNEPVEPFRVAGDTWYVGPRGLTVLAVRTTGGVILLDAALAESVPQIIDHAITATMSRTIITHGCTQLMVCSMLIFGGETLFYFALALTIGILFGIYSSVLVASPIVMWLGVSREDLARPEVQKKPGESGAVV